MPLKHSDSKAAISQNIHTETQAGRPHDQAVAIALHTADMAKLHQHHKATGDHHTQTRVGGT